MSERIPSDPSPFPEFDFHIMDRVLGVALIVGGALLRHLRWEPRPAASDHYRPEIYSMTDQQVMDEWRKQNINDDVEKQLRMPFDSEGSYHHFE